MSRASPASTPSGLPTLLAVSTALFALLAGAYTQGWIVGFDTSVAEWIAATMPAWAEWAARPFTWLGSLLGLTLLTAIAAGWLALRRSRLDAVLLVGVLLASQLVVHALKDAFDRPRPDAGSPIPLPDSSSLPSGHAASAVAVLVAIALLSAETMPSPRRALLVGVSFAAAFCVGASRIVLDVHYVSDVAAGFCLGLGVLCAGFLLREAILGRRGRRPATARGATEGDRGPARLGP